MFLTFFVTLGVFLLLAARKPIQYRLVIAFAAWHSLAHSATMLIQTVETYRHGALTGNQTRKNRLVLRGAVGVWICESSDRIKGCDGACIHAVSSLAGADGWSVTNVAAFPISGMQVRRFPRFVRSRSKESS
jgi:hypothetical protein